MNSIDRDSAATLLHQYSEWLDGEVSIAGEPGDERTHDDLVAQFLADRSDLALPPVGGQRVEGQTTFGCMHTPYGDSGHCAEMSCPNYVGKHTPVLSPDADLLPLDAEDPPHPAGYHPRTGQRLEPVCMIPECGCDGRAHP